VQRVPISELRTEFKDGIFLAKSNWLAGQYTQMIQLRRDGNCFVRAFATGLMLHLQRSSKEEQERVLALFANALDFVCSSGGYESFVVEDFWETFVDMLRSACRSSEDEILERMNGMDSDCCVTFLRCLIGAVMCEKQDLFLSFLPDVFSMRDYVRSEIDVMGRESEETSVMALADFSRLTIRVENLDLSIPKENQATDSVIPTNSHYFPLDASTENIAMVLLYRPGHFDLLVK
jgi:ubiquitin thioesterase protein OTUB1